jgi:predicted NBD/HSP70 family sugar kinase
MILAIDTGGTKTLLASFDASGTKQIITKFPTPRDTDEYLQSVVAAIEDHMQGEPITALSVAMPGPIREHKVLRTPNIGWSDFDVIRDLGAFFPGVPVFLQNDAALAGIAEAREFTPGGLSVYVTLSTGVGGGITFDGHLFPELERFEVGSMRVEYEGELHRWEDVASGKRFYERHGQYGSDVTDPDIWQNYAERVAVGMQILISLLEPDHVIIGGSMGTHFAKYGDLLQAILNERIAKHMAVTTISQAAHPEEAVIYGCYYHALDSLAP